MAGTEATDDFLERFRAYSDARALLPDNGVVIVGASGGIDSMSLLDLLSRMGVPVKAVHVNYGLRGSESDDDERLVSETCDRWCIPFEIFRADEAWLSTTGGRSLQEAARDLRYRIMLDAALGLGSQTVAVAHHQDDQAETLLLRLMRGTGASGLAGMACKRLLARHESILLIRPLLFASRHEIAEYARDRNIPYRSDRSNRDERFDRVRVRHSILPAIREAFGESAVRNIAEAADRVREAMDDGIGPLVDADLARMVEERGGHIFLDADYLAALPEGRRRLALFRAIQRYLPAVPHRSTVIERTEALLNATPGKRLEFDSGAIWRDRQALVLIPKSMDAAEDPAPIRSGVRNETAYGFITLEQVDPSEERSLDANMEVVDASVLDQPLTLGPWFPGERFQPLGMAGTKKISDFLTDAKVPTYRRRSIPVLRSGAEVVWIPGLRIAHRFRITGKSTAAIRIRFESLGPADTSRE